MSELINVHDNRATIRWKLLTGASALALTAYVSSAAVSKADDADRPQVWIELGGQLESQTGQGDVYTPPFFANYPSSAAFKPISPLHLEKPPLLSLGEDGKITFQPEDSDWIFSASIRYGRSSKTKSVQQKTPGHPVHYAFFGGYTASGGFAYNTGTFVPGIVNYADTDVRHQDKHAIIDFQAGKDVGLGLFGRSGESEVSVGVRIAQFTAKSSAVLHARPDIAHYNGRGYYHYPSRILQYSTFPNFYFPTTKFHVFGANANSERNFRGLGPSISWNASIPLAGNTQAGELTLDWGVNAALLFGRRTAKGQHHESGHYHRPHFFPYNNFAYYSNNASFDRSQNVTVPNVGGFAGMSFKFPNAKVSIGYRADMFFNAMDVGWDTAKKSNAAFHGPFASISFGIGD